MKPTSTLRHFLLLAGSSLLTVFSAQAADGTWTLNNNGNWSTPGNWSGGTVADGIGSSAFLSDVISGNRNITLDTPRTIGNIYAQDTTHNYTIIGANTLTLDASSGQSILDVVTGRTLTINTAVTVNDGIEKTGDGAVTFGGPVTLGAAQTWTNDSAGALTTTIANQLDNSGFDLTFDGSGVINIGTINNATAVLTGSGGVIKDGTGRLNIGGVNSGFTGTVTINGGVLQMTNNAAGLGAGNVTLNGGVLSFYWGTAYNRTLGTGDNQVQITGGESGFGGAGTTGPTINLGASVVWGALGEGAATGYFNPGKFVLGDEGTSNAGVVTFSSGIDLNGATRTIVVPYGTSATGNVSTISGAITSTGTGGLIKEGAGTLVLTNANTYDGGTTIDGGTLLFDNIAAMPSSGNVQVNDGGIIGIRVGGGGNWTGGTSGVGTIGGLLAGDGGAGSSTVSYTGNVGLLLNVGGNITYNGDIADVGTTLALYKTGNSSLTLGGNNSYSGGTTLTAGSLIADSSTALGTSGDIAFRGGTLQYTANSAANDYGSRIANSTSAIALNTNGQDITLSGMAAGNTGGLTKTGAGTLTFTGTNTYSGATTLSAGTLAINDGTLNTSGGAVSLASNTTLSILGGIGVNSTWDLGNQDFQQSGSNVSNIQVVIDGDGVEGSAVLNNVKILTWGRTITNSTIAITDGGQMNVTGEVRIGNPYYSSAGGANISIGGGTATSTFSGDGGDDFYIGYGERRGSNNNVVTVSSSGVLTNIRDMFVGHVNNSQNNGAPPSTANQLTVTGTGTASMRGISVGYAQVGFEADANVVEVTGGGSLSTTGAGYIGRANTSGSQSNANTLTVSGTGSEWDAGNQNVFVGHTNNASATSNDNILTVGAGGSLTNVNEMTVGFGSGTETGNQLVVNGSLTVNLLTVSTDNSLSGSGTINGATTINGALNPGTSPGVINFTDSLTLASTATTTMEIDGTVRGGGYDGIDVGATLAYGGALVLDLGTVFGAGNYTFDLFDFGLGDDSGTFDSVTLAGLYSGSFTESSGVWGYTEGDSTWTFTQSTGDLNLSVIPEPTTALLGAIGLLTLLRRRR